MSRPHFWDCETAPVFGPEFEPLGPSNDLVGCAPALVPATSGQRRAERTGACPMQLRARLCNACSEAELQLWRPILAKPELLVFCGPENGVARQPLTWASSWQTQLARHLSCSFVGFSVDRSHASSSGKLTNVASTFSLLVQSRRLDIAE